jgi:peptidoglycan L-alanyl-D-glutamate endopeptidase CwlK
MPFSLSERSRKNLESCDQAIKTLVYEALKEYDVVVVEGWRDKETQDKYYSEGKSKLRWPDSRHNKQPSRAVDLGIFNKDLNGIDWANLNPFFELAGYLKAVARQKGIKMRWGGDYKHFKDYPHFELLT